MYDNKRDWVDLTFKSNSDGTVTIDRTPLDNRIENRNHWGWKLVSVVYHEKSQAYELFWRLED